MKFLFSMDVPAIGEFPGAKLNSSFELEKEEYLAVLPHVLEMRKVALTFVKDVVATIGPDVIAAGNKIMDSQRDLAHDRFIREQRRAEELHELHKRAAQIDVDVAEQVRARR